MKTLMKHVKSTLLIASIATGLMIGSTQQCKAAYYNNHYSNYVYYLSLYSSTHVVQYYYVALAYYYYFAAGYNGDLSSIPPDQAVAAIRQKQALLQQTVGERVQSILTPDQGKTLKEPFPNLISVLKAGSGSS